MIRSIADLTEQLAAIGMDRIDGTGIVRPDYIGDMYEGLASELLRSQFPNDLELRLVEGLLVGDNGEVSDQKDWVLVRGDVEQLPFSEHFRIPLWQAVAVFEIKKSFSPRELKEYLVKLSRINDLYDHFSPRWGALQASLARCRGYRLSYEDDPYGFGEPEEHLRSSILEDLSLPLRIGIGFHGPKRWRTFRRHCLDALRTEEAAAAFHPLPNLVISGEHALVKTIGAPYTVAAPEELMISYATSHNDVWLLLAKVIWWRLIEDHGYRWPVYSDDDTPEALLPLTALIVPDKTVGAIELDNAIVPGHAGDPAPLFEVSVEAYGLIMTLNVLDQQWFPEEEESLIAAYSNAGPTLADLAEELLATGLYRRGMRDGIKVVYQVPSLLASWLKAGKAHICDNTFNRAVRAQMSENAINNPGKSLHLFFHEGSFAGAYEYELGTDAPGQRFEHIRLALQKDVANKLTGSQQDDDGGI